MEKLTPQEAIETGYTHYTIDQSGEYGLISNILEPWFNVKDADVLLVLDKEKTAFSYSPDDIRNILQDNIQGQEEYSNEDDELSNELDEADFDKIAELVNVGFEKRFMFPTEIELDLSGLKGDFNE